MPKFDLIPPGSVSDQFLNTVLADRIAEKAEEVTPLKGDWLEGHKRLIGFSLLAIGMLANHFGWNLPQDQINGFWGWLQANWGALSEGAGMLVGIYGSIMASIRHNKEVAVVKTVAKEAVKEAVVAKAEVAEVKSDLHEANKVITELKQ